MKWKVMRLFLPLLVLGFVVPLVMPGPNGRPIMSLSDWMPDRATMVTLERFLGKLTRVADEGPGVITEPEVVYKWKDEHGVWHFTNDPEKAPEGIGAQDMPAVANQMPPPEMRDDAGSENAAPPFELPVVPGLPDSSVADMLGNAQDIREMSEERIKALEEL